MPACWVYMLASKARGMLYIGSLPIAHEAFFVALKLDKTEEALRAGGLIGPAP